MVNRSNYSIESNCYSFNFFIGAVRIQIVLLTVKICPEHMHHLTLCFCLVFIQECILDTTEVFSSFFAGPYGFFAGSASFLGSSSASAGSTTIVGSSSASFPISELLILLRH
jgi:hypothetical protein